MLEDVHEKSLDAHHRRVHDESAAVLDPLFWEQRRDPECMPYLIVTYGVSLCVNFLNILQTMAMVSVFGVHRENLFGVMRWFADLPFRLPCCHAMGIAFSAFLGLEMPTGRPSRYSVCMMWMYQLSVLPMMCFKVDGHLFISDFLLSVVGSKAFVILLLTYAKFLTEARVTTWGLLWYVVAVQGTIGAWITSVPILLMYQLLLARNGIIASIYLTLAFSASEATFVKFLSFCYANLVIKKRKDDPSCIEGDQKWTLSICIYCVHAFTETARLASLMSGAIVSKDESFLMGAIISILSSTALNTAVRSAMVSRLTIRIPVIGRFFCPTSLWGVHNNAKFTMGWGRFFSVFGLMLGRGMIHGQWGIPLIAEPGMHNVWCWSGLVLLTIFLAFGSEVMEDMLVFWFANSEFPYPASPVYEEIMHRRLKDPHTAARQHVCHYAIPPATESVSNDFGEDVLNKVRPSPSLTNQRIADSNMVFAVTCATSVLLITDLSVGVGSGNLFGFCRPLDFQTDSFVLIFRNVALWDMQCDF